MSHCFSFTISYVSTTKGVGTFVGRRNNRAKSWSKAAYLFYLTEQEITNNRRRLQPSSTSAMDWIKKSWETFCLLSKSSNSDCFIKLTVVFAQCRFSFQSVGFFCWTTELQLFGLRYRLKVLGFVVKCIFFFSNLTYIRRFLYSFRLPGEAQKIDRVLSAFAEHYYKTKVEEFFQSSGGSWLRFELLLYKMLTV